MKHLLLLTFLHFSISVFSQEFAIENRRQNIAYAGTSTYLHCVVNGYPEKFIRLTTNNGVVKEVKNAAGDFIFIPICPVSVKIVNPYGKTIIL